MIVIPVYDQFDMLDVTGPYEMFRWANIPVKIVAQHPGLVKCNGIISIEVTEGLVVGPDEVGALWTPGGAPASLNELMYGPDRTYLDFLVAQSAKAKYTASVCEGALLLAAAGLLDGFEVTTHWAFTPCLRKRFPKVKVVEGHPRFCLDRDRLTGGGISSGLDEALKLITLLKGEACAKFVQQTTQYYPDPPVCSLIPKADGCPLDDPSAPLGGPC